MPASPAVLPVAEYGVASRPWRAELGHHRALVKVEATSAAVRIRIPWRRRDPDPAAKDVIVVESASGERVANVARLAILREYGDIVFQAARPGVYEIYYMPYAPETTNYYYGKGYTPPTDTADPGWVRDHSPAAADAWRGLPEASLVRIESRTEFDTFFPMEVVATGDEVAGLVAAHPGQMLLFAEDRRLPIRMTSDLPVRWVRGGPTRSFHGEALRNEYYALQIGVFAPRVKLENLAIAFSDLRRADGKPAIAASALHCINLGGTDTNGVEFRKRVDLSPGHVQALWVGVDVARTAAPGAYAGTITVSADGVAPIPLEVRLTVGSRILADRGDCELWRHSRLRWLDSAAGIDDEVVAPYTPLRVRGRTVRCLGRSVRFGADGLPASIQAGGVELLAAPVRFVVEAGGAAVGAPMGGRVVRRSAASVAVAAVGGRGAASVECRAEMEFDGHILYKVRVTAAEPLRLGDVRLELPLRPGVARYFMGAGRKGGLRPAAYDWKWTGPWDSFWIGDVPAGIHCELRGGAYNGPLLNLFHPAPPATWSNGGRGGVELREAPDGGVTVRAYSGPREIAAGETVTFEFALIVTPVKPLDTARAFHYRYYHGGDKPVISDYSAGSGINVINVHHANPVNPYINYPFLANAGLKALVRKWQARAMKVKLYYTVRELTNYVTELWALRSLGREVLDGGPGGGFTWLREHLVRDYTSQWYVPYPDGTADAAILTSGESRWYNYYIEGLAWLVKNIGIDGLYLDDVSFDRRILKRMRKVMEANHPGSMMDLHSNTAFSIGPANQYMEFMPFVDKVWFGESFRYNEEPPDYWLTEISGIPFGVMGEMLQAPTNAWRGMLYGITSRTTWDAPEAGDDPRPIYRLWDSFGIGKARMRGYWDPQCPVRTDNPEVLATAYVRKGRVLIALASWAPGATTVRLKFDWAALGIDPSRAALRAPAVRGVQTSATFAVDAAIPVERLRGWMLVLEGR